MDTTRWSTESGRNYEQKEEVESLQGRLSSELSQACIVQLYC
jgi:hypothetical protein